MMFCLCFKLIDIDKFVVCSGVEVRVVKSKDKQVVFKFWMFDKY